MGKFEYKLLNTQTPFVKETPLTKKHRFQNLPKIIVGKFYFREKKNLGFFIYLFVAFYFPKNPNPAALENQ